MPLIDMPLEKLKKYMGTNPRPDDFDEYWERGLKEMGETNPETQLVKNKFQLPYADCFDLYFNGTKNGRIHAKLLIPKNIKGKAPVVLHFHGYYGKSHNWMYYAGFAAMGFIVAGMDCRGQAGLSDDKNPVCGNNISGHIIRGLDEPNPDNMYYRNVFLDTAMLARVVSELEQADGDKMAAFGGSQGGALTVACACLVPNLKMAAPCYPFLSDYKRVWDMDLDQRAYDEIRSYFRMFDPCHERENEIFTKLGYIDLHNMAERINAKMMFGTGLMDDVCPPSTQFAVYNRIKSEKSMVIYPDFGHENLPDFEEKMTEMFCKLL